MFFSLNPLINHFLLFFFFSFFPCLFHWIFQSSFPQFVRILSFKSSSGREEQEELSFMFWNRYFYRPNSYISPSSWDSILFFPLPSLSLVGVCVNERTKKVQFKEFVMRGWKKQNLQFLYHLFNTFFLPISFSLYYLKRKYCHMSDVPTWPFEIVKFQRLYSFILDAIFS